MPQITIRTSPEYHSTETYTEKGTACKFIVSQLLEMDPDLSLAEVVTDTVSEYSVRIRVMGSSVGFSINNSQTVLYVQSGYWDSKGVFIQRSGYSLSNYFGYYYSYSNPEPSWYPKIKVSVVGVDGVLKYVTFQTSYTANFSYLYYGMFTSTARSAPEYCVGVSNAAVQYPALPVIPFASTLPGTIRNELSDSYETITFRQFTDISGSSTGFVKAGYTHALLPNAFYGYTDTNAFLNIKWGGKYNIYHLYDANGIVKTGGGETVTINGVEMLSPGYVTVIE